MATRAAIAARSRSSPAWDVEEVISVASEIGVLVRTATPAMTNGLRLPNGSMTGNGTVTVGYDRTSADRTGGAATPTGEPARRSAWQADRCGTGPGVHYPTAWPQLPGRLRP
ncbi:hypothetical protein GCM10027290_21520 [Micromonospora sonneratiae]